MKRIMVAMIILVATQANAFIIDYETMSGYRSTGIYGWNYAYDIGFIDDRLRIDVDVRLIGYTPAADRPKAGPVGSAKASQFLLDTRSICRVVCLDRLEPLCRWV